MSLKGVTDLRLREKISSKFTEIDGGEKSNDWLAKFEGKSKVESLAQLREIQTACLVVRYIVVLDLQERTKIR